MDKAALLESLAPVTVVVGHYGVGKTNFCLNLALDAAAAGAAVTLADLDVVNPYFRSSEYRTLLEEHGVTLIAPVFARAGTSLDVPSLTGAVIPAINRAYHEARTGGEGRRPVVIIDAGGDDVGATALVRFAPAIQDGPHEVWYVVNGYRNLTGTPEEAAAILAEIEAKSHLTATGIVNNSHLQGETTLGHIAECVPFAQTTARVTGRPLRCTTVPESAIQQENDGSTPLECIPESYPVQVLVSTPWG